MPQVTEGGVTISTPHATEDQIKATFLVGKEAKDPVKESVKATETTETPDPAKEAAKTVEEKLEKGEKLTHKERRNPDARIAEMNRDKRLIAQELANVRAQLEAMKSVKPPDPPNEKDPKFTDYTQFVEEKVRHEAARIVAENERRRMENAEIGLIEQSKRQLAIAYRDRIQEVLAEDPKFFDNVSEDMRTLVPVTAMDPGKVPGPENVIAEEIFRSEVPDRLMRFFTQNADQYRRIATMRSPREIAREIARIEAKLDSDENAGSSVRTEGEVKLAVSKAHKPVRPVTGTPNPDETEVSDELDADEYTRRRLIELREKKSRR